MEQNIGIVFTAMGALVIVVNIMTEVLKKFTEKYIPTNFVATVLSIILTLCAFFGYCAIFNITAEWYLVTAAIVAGFFVAYAAMFGFDKLKQTIKDNLDK